jgi:hypothetical protein
MSVVVIVAAVVVLGRRLAHHRMRERS